MSESALTDPELARLLQGAGRGIQSDLKGCISAFGRLVWAMSRKALPHEDAEEVTQDVFAELWRVAHRFDPKKGRPITFVAVLARRRITDRIRRLDRAKRIQIVDTNAVQQPQLHPAKESVQTIESLELIRSKLEELPSNQSRAIRAVLDEGLTQEEAAKALNLPLGTLKSQYRRGLQTLRKLVVEKTERRQP